MVEVSTSILSIKKGEESKTFFALEKAKTDYFHIDVMDGKFVEKNTYDKMFEYASYIKRISNLPLDIHLMVENVGKAIQDFSAVEPNIITFHFEAEKNKEEILEKIDINLKNKNNKQSVFLNGEDVTDQIRTPEVTGIVSKTSSIFGVREKITRLERKIGYEWLKEGKNIIMEGRDITTVVFPEAKVKIYLDATPIERAKRRCRQNKRNGINQSFEEVLQSIMERDKNDMNKKVGALKKAPDAIYVDSSKSSVNKIKHKIIKIIKQKTKENRNEHYKKNIKSNS